MPVSVAYPFVTVAIDDSGLRPAVTRAPGVLAVIGATGAGAASGAATANKPIPVPTLDDAASLFSGADKDGVVRPNPLYSALEIAFLQDPGPSRIYGVRTGDGGVAAALQALEGVSAVTFVALAGTHTAPAEGPATTGGTADADLVALQKHVEDVSHQGNNRMGVAAVNPLTTRSDTYVDAVGSAMSALESNRMVVVAARGATGDVAVAAAAAIAGYPPSVSMVLKQVRGLVMPLASQFSPGEIAGLSELGIIPVIDPVLISGDSLHLAEGRTFKPGDPRQYIDTVRTLDDIDFRLKAGLVGMIGDARITRSGLTLVQARIEGILGVVAREGAIDGFSVAIPVLDILAVPEGSRSEPDKEILGDARTNRTVAATLQVTLAPATHRIDIALALQN